MADKKLPTGNVVPSELLIRSTKDLGELVRQARKVQHLKQVDIAGLANTGNRFIVDLEAGKPTIQLQKAIEVLSLLGLDLVVRRRGARS